MSSGASVRTLQHVVEQLRLEAGVDRIILVLRVGARAQAVAELRQKPGCPACVCASQKQPLLGTQIKTGGKKFPEEGRQHKVMNHCLQVSRKHFSAAKRPVGI